MNKSSTTFEEDIIKDIFILTGIDATGWHFHHIDSPKEHEAINLDLWNVCNALCESPEHEELNLVNAKSKVLILSFFSVSSVSPVAIKKGLNRMGFFSL